MDGYKIKVQFMVEILFLTLMINRMKKYIPYEFLISLLKEQCDPNPWVTYESYIEEYERQTKQKQ